MANRELGPVNGHRPRTSRLRKTLSTRKKINKLRFTSNHTDGRPSSNEDRTPPRTDPTPPPKTTPKFPHPQTLSALPFIIIIAFFFLSALILSYNLSDPTRVCNLSGLWDVTILRLRSCPHACRGPRAGVCIEECPTSPWRGRPPVGLSRI